MLLKINFCKPFGTLKYPRKNYSNSFVIRHVNQLKCIRVLSNAYDKLKFLQKDSIIDVWQSSKCTSAILWNGNS